MKRLSLLFVFAAALSSACVSADAAQQAPAPGAPAWQGSPPGSPPAFGPGPPQWQQPRGPWQGRQFGPGQGGRFPPAGPPFGRRFFRGRGFGPGAFGPGGFGAQGSGPRGRFGQRLGPGVFLLAPRIRQELAITDEQATRIRQLGLEAREKMIRQRADAEIKQLELQRVLTSPNPDRAAIDRLVREMADLRAAQMKAGIDQRLAFQNLLTPQQKEKLRGLREGGFGPGAGGTEQRPGTRPAPQRGPARPAQPPAPQP